LTKFLKVTVKKWKENSDNILEVLKITHRLNASALPLIAVKSLLFALNPFTTIILSSMVIDWLTWGKTFNSILQLAGIGVGVIFLLNIISAVINKHCSVQIDYCHRLFESKIGEKTLEMDYQQLESTKTQDLRTRIHADNNWGGGIHGVSYCFEQTLHSVFSLFTAFIIIIPLFNAKGTSDNFSSGYTMLFFAFVLSITILTLRFRRFADKKKFTLFDKMTEQSRLPFYFLFGGGLEYKSGKDIRIYSAQNLIAQHISSVIMPLRKSTSDSMSRSSGMADGISAAVTGLIEGAAYLFVALRAAAGALSIGAVVKYAGSIRQLAASLSSLILMLHEFSVCAGRFRSTIAYFNIPDVLYKGTLPVEKRSDNEYEIQFVNVSFKYPGSEVYALKNLSLKLNIGERLAIVGMNGSGKTTFIKLLCRLYDPTSGEILLNGIDIRKYDYNEYMSIFSVVFQDFNLFSFSLGQNVATSVKYHRQKVSECLKKAGFDERLKDMSKGTDTPLYKNFEEDGVEISGGEAQKIALARALYKDAPFMVLDEPTAALDPIAEFEIYSKFNEIVGEKTAVYISHRLSSCRFCHDIAVFHEGQLIQRGNHDKLISNKNGKYYELWNAQAQYYA
jgi:ATP-binding cassette, subfamily B, bacterial